MIKQILIFALIYKLQITTSGKSEVVFLPGIQKAFEVCFVFIYLKLYKY